MREFLYDEKDRLAGEMIEGKPVPLPPAPEGDAFDDLLFDAVEMIEHHPMGHGELAGDLQPIADKHSPMLTYGRLQFQMTDKGTPDPQLHSLYGGGVHAFIAEGALRDVEQLRTALIEYVTRREELYRRGRIGKDGRWEFTVNDLWTLGKSFGLAGPPTKEQRAEADTVSDEEWQVRRREMIDEQKRMAEWERESDLKHRKKQLLNKLTREFFTVDDLDLLTEGHPPEYFIAQNKRKVFREFNKDLVSLLVDQDKPDEEIIEEVRKMNAVTKGVYESSVPDPLKEGERRHYVNTSLEVRDILAELDRTDQAVTHVTRIQLAMDGRYVLTIRQKTAEDYARDAEIDATAGTQ